MTKTLLSKKNFQSLNNLHQYENLKTYVNNRFGSIWNSQKKNLTIKKQKKSYLILAAVSAVLTSLLFSYFVHFVYFCSFFLFFSFWFILCSFCNDRHHSIWMHINIEKIGACIQSRIFVHFLCKFLSKIL